MVDGGGHVRLLVPHHLKVHLDDVGLARGDLHDRHVLLLHVQPVAQVLVGQPVSLHREGIIYMRTHRYPSVLIYFMSFY